MFKAFLKTQTFKVLSQRFVLAFGGLEIIRLIMSAIPFFQPMYSEKQFTFPQAISMTVLFTFLAWREYKDKHKTIIPKGDSM